MSSTPGDISGPPPWKLYERLVAFMESQAVDAALTVHPNVKLRGRISGAERQIDALIECRINDDRSKRISASLKADLDRYAALHAQTYGEAVDAVTLIPPMLGAFMAGDRGFSKAR